jgi:hypothetical protein
MGRSLHDPTSLRGKDHSAPHRAPSVGGLPHRPCICPPTIVLWPRHTWDNEGKHLLNVLAGGWAAPSAAMIDLSFSPCPLDILLHLVGCVLASPSSSLALLFLHCKKRLSIFQFPALQFIIPDRINLSTPSKSYGRTIPLITGKELHNFFLRVLF